MSIFDRLTENIVAVVKHLTARFDYHALYAGTALLQNADGTLDIQPDDPRFGQGFKHVPIRLGLPGAAVTIQSGSRALLGFENGDAQKPIAMPHDPGALASLAITAAGNISLAAAGNGNVAVTATGSGKISLVSSNPGGIVLGDGSGNALPVARIGDLVQVSGGGGFSPGSGVLVNGVVAPFTPPTLLLGNFVGQIVTGSAVASAD